MAFSEKTKLRVKKMAMFRCCRCQLIGIDVHHIIPQKDNGADTIENAAPLCQNCHNQFGDNLVKRKEIIQMRDNWYEVIDRMYHKDNVLEKPIMELSDRLDLFAKNHESNLTEIKRELKELSSKAIDQLNIGTIISGASAIANASLYPSEGGTIFNGAGKKCSRCGYYLSFTSPFCSSCGADNS